MATNMDAHRSAGARLSSTAPSPLPCCSVCCLIRMYPHLQLSEERWRSLSLKCFTTPWSQHIPSSADISVYTCCTGLIKVLRLRTFITKQQSKSIQRLTPYNSWPKPNDTLSPPTNMCNAALIWFQLLPLTSDRKHLKCFFFDFSQRELRFADTNFF